jgi:hypothetical protein
MDPKQALEFLAAAARQVYPIGRIDEYNAAITALAKMIDQAAKPKDEAPA